MNYTTNQFTTGRKKIFCYEQNITKDNVIAIVEAAKPTFEQNNIEIERLFQLYRGRDEDIVGRKRIGVNTEINTKGFVSYYSLIADYTANLFMQNQMILVNVDGKKDVSEALIEYNKIHRNNNKYARDKQSALHAAICGWGYRFVQKDRDTIINDSVLSPKSVMSIYGDDTDDRVMARVYVTQVLDKEAKLVSELSGQRDVNVATKDHYTIYTDKFTYSFTDGDETAEMKEALGIGIPIIEYKLNPFYIGSFERSISLIQMLSLLRSDATNGVIQSIAGVLFGKNIGLANIGADDDEDTIKFKEEINRQMAEQMKAFRQLFVNDSKEGPASLEYIGTELYNADIEVLYQGIVKDITTISMIPNSVVNMGGSGNAGAADTASGVKQALEHAANSEPFWFESAREQLKVELLIAKEQGKLTKLDAGDLSFAMQRNISIDPIVATQAMETMLKNGITISDAVEYVGMSADPIEFEQRTLANMAKNEERKLEYVRREQEIINSTKETSEEVITVVE